MKVTIKKISFLFMVLFLLPSCGKGSENSVTASASQNVYSSAADLSDDEITLIIPNDDADGWRNEMIFVYQLVRESLPAERQTALLHTQISYEAYLSNTAGLYNEIIGGSAQSYEASLYRQRTLELVELYQQLSDTPYTFFYPQQPNNTSSKPKTFTPEEYTLIRQEFPYTYKLDYQDTDYGFLEIDQTAGMLERYADDVLREISMYQPAKEIIDLSVENDFIYLSAVSNTPTAAQTLRGYKTYTLDLLGYYSSTREHIAQTARLLFGDDCEIDFDNLENTGRYPYDKHLGVGIFSAISKEGHQLVVVNYADLGDHYTAEVVFLHWDTSFSESPYSYYDGESFINLTEDEAKEHCRNILPKYEIVINKGEDNGLYFISKTLKK